MIGRHVDEPRALIGGDEIARQERPRLGEETAKLVHRMAGDRAGEVGAFDDLKRDHLNPIVRNRIGQPGGDKNGLSGCGRSWAPRRSPMRQIAYSTQGRTRSLD